MLIRIKTAAKVLLGRGTVPASHAATVFPDDVFLVSYPRSGNTWARFLIGNLVSPDGMATFANIEKIIPDIYQNSDDELLNVPRPRILKSHQAFNPQYPKVIYLVRDPRDVAISYYHYLVKIGRMAEDAPFDEFVKRFVAGGLDSFGTWGEHVGSWLGARQGRSDFLLARYEDLLEQPAVELERMARFLNIDATRDALERAKANSSFEAMRSLEHSQSDIWRTTRQSRKDKAFVRSGRAGQWQSVLSPDELRVIEQSWPTQMKTLGYGAADDNQQP